MRLIRALLAYDGTAFRGWQSQPNAPSVQAAVHKALHQIHGHAVKTTAASRTDGGVHAEGQVIHFESDSYLTDAKLRIAINFNVPSSVAVRSLKTVKPPFHARYGAKGKLYRYVIYTGKTKPIFERPHVWWLPSPLDVAAMRRGAKFLVGKHDFTSFSVPSPDDKSKVRTITSIRIRREKDRLVLEVKGGGFLHNMVRIIVGTLVHAGFGKLQSVDVKRILEAKDRKAAGPTAPAQGLTLVRVYY